MYAVIPIQILLSTRGVCRDHPTVDCEADGPAGPNDFDLFFPGHETPEAWYRRKFKNRVGWLDKGKKKKRAA
ncbi:MAG: hypothetical protein HY083_09490 [Gammaproteobacteria bacterium]|nr:hypothetical protein [Gammaproteobacteria bacterium]